MKLEEKSINMGFLSKIFYHTGKASATRPITSIFVGLVLVLVGAIGFVNFQSTVSDDNKLVAI